jgi:8-amino-7-oxononanoate synthase
MGTLSKALGSLGGYVAGSAVLIDFLRNRAPSWIYTTGLSPADTAAALAAIAIVRQEPQRRDRLWDNVANLKRSLQSVLSDSNAKLLPSDSPIVCVQLDSPARALEVGWRLQEAGIFAATVRPPTVPTSRIRLTVMATHEREHINQLVEGLREALI